MADTGKWFKSSTFGGFRRHDVITYIEALLKDHHEEIDSYRAGADLLRRERDEARDQMTAMQGRLEEMDQVSKQTPALQANIDSLRARVSELLSQKAQLCEHLQKMKNAREADLAALSEMQHLLSEKQKSLTDLQNSINDFQAAYVNAEAMEKQARDRAEEIEAEARDHANALKAETQENAARSRDLIARLWRETRSRYASLYREADDVSALAACELDKARQLVVSAGQMFGAVNSRLANMPLPEQPDIPSPEPAPEQGLPSLMELLAQQGFRPSDQKEFSFFDMEKQQEQES